VPDLVRIMKATQKTVDRFKGRTFEEGRVDCIQLANGHAGHMGKRVKIPEYGDLESAARTLRQMGFRTLGEALDANFRRIDPHQAMMGDLIEMPGGNGFSSIAVAVGNGRVLGFHEDIPHCDILQPVLVSGAWRIG
jgi:hypothetical protein